MNIEKNNDRIKITEDDYTLIFSYQNDDMSLWADVTTSKKGNILKAQKVKEYLEQLKITGNIDYNGINNLCGLVQLGKKAENIPVMNGTLPIDGKSGQVKFLAQPTKDASSYNPQSIEKRDYHNLHLFDNVKNGQAIAQILKETKGTNGQDLKGKEFPAKQGESFRITLGDGVRMGISGKAGESSDLIFTKQSGRIEYNETSSTISVTDKYIVSGDAGYEIGDIDFIGFVEIHGDVVDGFNVKGDKGVFIKGNVEASRIESKRDIEINGGISGKGKGLIKCGGNVYVRYIDDAIVEVIKNLEVKNEIIDSNVKVRGSIIVSKGAIIGGNILALGGIEARVFGLNIGIKTVITAGRCFISDNKIDVLEQELKDNTTRLEKISVVLDKVLRHPKKGMQLSSEEKLKIRKLSVEFTSLNQRNFEIPELITTINKDVENSANFLINVWKTIEKGVHVHLGSRSFSTEKSINKKMSIVENSRNDNMRFIDLISLKENARNIERAITKIEKQKEEKDKNKMEIK